MLLLDEIELSASHFLTRDGKFYFAMLQSLRKNGYFSLDEVTILSQCSEEVIEKYEERGGWETIQHQMDIINKDNFEKYLDLLYRENILISMFDDGFNLMTPITINEKKVVPLRLFRKMTAEEVTDWYEARMTTYGTGYSSKVLEEEEIDFDEEFFDSCAEGENNGVPFAVAGLDINLEEINCFPFLSNQINGFLEGTLSMIGGYSSTGKTSWWTTVVMALLEQDRKVLIISNEEDCKKFKIRFIVWMLGKYLRYFKLTKKKLMSGQVNDTDREKLTQIKDYWKDNFKGRLKFIAINDADMSIVKKKIRENVLRYGYDTVLYDTFKIQEGDYSAARQDLALVRDSRELDKLAKKYNLIMLASVQLAEHTRSKLFLDSSVLSNSKQIKEILENLFLMRNVYNDDELDPKSKLYCKPFRLKKVNDKWIEEPYECDLTAVWRILFIEKCRSGRNSSDTGVAYLLKYDGDHCIFREVAQCRPKHGQIT